MAQPPRKIPYGYQDKLSEHLKRLKDDDIIEDAPMNKPTTWISNLVFAPKPKDPDPAAVRICLDSRVPNRAIKRNKHDIPSVQDILLDINGATVFSHLDLNAGYHQLELDEASRDITTFYTHEGNKRYKRLLFGIVSAQDEFDRAIRKTISGIKGARNISDDIIVFGRTQVEHDKSLVEVFQRLADANLTLKKEKCVFNQPEITFFGFRVTKDGIRPDNSKVEALKNATQPSSKEDVRSFLAMASASRMFAPNFSKITAPLRELIKDGIPFIWDTEEKEAFEKLQNSLSNDSLLAHFEPGKALELHVDYHRSGLGATLLQLQSCGNWKPITYISRSTTDPESRYSQTEGEAFSVRWACERLRVYLIGVHFTVVTDHQPLVPMFNNPYKSLPIRIERMMMYLQEFDFDTVFQAGKSSISDYLSRHTLPSNVDKTPCTLCKKCNFEEDVVKTVINPFKTTVQHAITVEDIKQETTKDDVLQNLIKIIRRGNWTSYKQDPRYKPFFMVRDELFIVDDMVVKGSRIVIPQYLQDRVVKLAHRGHQGIVRSKAFLRSCCWFPGVNKKTELAVRHCLPCQVVKPYEVKAPARMTQLPEFPWQKIAVDHVGPFPSGEYCLVIIDEYSRYPEIKIVRSTSASTNIPKFKEIFANHGVPQVLKSDNGPPFNSEEFQKFSEEQGFYHRRITPEYPEENGDVENFMRNINRVAQIAKIEKKNWEEELTTFLSVYRNTPHPSTGKSPNEIVKRYPVRALLPRVIPSMEDQDVRNEMPPRK